MSSTADLFALQSTEVWIVLQGSWKGKSDIVGLCWAKAADCDFVMVTRAGLELYTLTADRQAGNPLLLPLSDLLYM